MNRGQTEQHECGEMMPITSLRRIIKRRLHHLQKALVRRILLSACDISRTNHGFILFRHRNNEIEWVFADVIDWCCPTAFRADKTLLELYLNQMMTKNLFECEATGRMRSTTPIALMASMGPKLLVSWAVPGSPTRASYRDGIGPQRSRKQSPALALGAAEFCLGRPTSPQKEQRKGLRPIFLGTENCFSKSIVAGLSAAFFRITVTNMITRTGLVMRLWIFTRSPYPPVQYTLEFPRVTTFARAQLTQIFECIHNQGKRHRHSTTILFADPK
jgi:hypothetical protein